MANLKALVTGGKGYIGSQLAKQLIDGRRLTDREVDVTIFDNLSHSERETLDGQCEFIEGDLRKIGDVRELLENRKFDMLFHFAAFIEVGESNQNPKKYWKNNLLGSFNLFQTAAVNEACPNIVFSSTAAVYKTSDLPITEDFLTVPASVYGQTKLAVEHLLLHLKDLYRINPCIFRYFNVAGAHPDGTLGETHKPETHAIARFLLEGMTQTPAFIWGKDYETKDGTGIRDYIHVQDLVEAHILAGEKMLQGSTQSRIYNLGTKTGYSVAEVLEQVQQVIGLELDIREGERRPGDTAKLVADPSRAITELGWQRQYELRQMIEHTYKFYQNRPDLVTAYKNQKAAELKRTQ